MSNTILDEGWRRSVDTLEAGYRWLYRGEVLEPGDEFFMPDRWVPTGEVGAPVLTNGRYRRKIITEKTIMPNITTPPLANGYRLDVGYRWLETGETLETGDEYHSGYDFWALTGFVGKRVNEGQVYRRKLQPPTPKPPLRLVPRNIWIETCKSARKSEVVNAIHRYLDAGKDVPAAWLEELIELTK